MRLPAYKDVAERLRQIPGIRTGRGATKEDIAAAENHLRVKFPPSYADFLTDVGWAAWGDLTLFGTGREVPDRFNVLFGQPESDALSSGSRLVIAKARSGRLFVLDNSYDGAYESPVYELQSENDDADASYVSHDFASWLLQQIANPQRNES